MREMGNALQKGFIVVEFDRCYTPELELQRCGFINDPLPSSLKFHEVNVKANVTDKKT